MRPGMPSRKAINFMAALVALSCGGLGAAEDVEPAYEISFSPNQPVLSLRHTGGLGRYGARYTLYGDGRLVTEQIDRGTGAATDTAERKLEHADLEALMDLAITAGLAECDESRIEELLGQPPPRVADGATFYLEITLDSYKSARRHEAQPFTHTLSVHSPSSLSRLFPGVREIDGLLAVYNALRTYGGKD